MVALAAVELCCDLGFHDILLEGDSLNVVKAQKDKQPNLHRYGHVVEDTHLLLRSMRSWAIGHVNRESNQTMHNLAKEASKNSIDRV